MKKITLFLLCSSVIILTSCGNKDKAVHPVKKDIIQAVYASGKVFPLHHYTVVSKFPGYIQKVHVNAGDHVKIGQLLLTVRNEAGQLNTMTARNQYELARQNADENGTLLNSLRQEVNSAYSKYKMDSLTFYRLSDLLKQNATSVQSNDQAKTQFDISLSAWKRAKENYENTRSRLQVELKNAENVLRAQESNDRDYTILSVIDGKVYDVSPEPGDLVNPQLPLMEIGDSSQFEVELSVDETDISYLNVGQEIAYSIDAFPGKIFKGKITELYPKVNVASKTSRVKGSIEYEKTVELYSGMSVEANIIYREKKGALVIPRDYLVNGDKVYIKSKDDAVEVKTGVSDLEYIEILSGLSENDVLRKK